MTGINIKKINTQKGFTIVELTIVMAIFLLVIGAAITIFLSIVSSQTSAVSEQKSFNQTSYAMERISKALRMAKADLDGACMPKGSSSSAYIYKLTRPDITTQTFRGVKFINQSNSDACTEFFVQNEDPNDPSTPLILKELINSTNDDDAVPLTSSSVKINYIKFAINGSYLPVGSPIDGARIEQYLQPRITILLSIEVKEGSKTAERLIQTTISQRNINAE